MVLGGAGKGRYPAAEIGSHPPLGRQYRRRRGKHYRTPGKVVFQLREALFLSARHVLEIHEVRAHLVHELADLGARPCEHLLFHDRIPAHAEKLIVRVPGRPGLFFKVSDNSYLFVEEAQFSKLAFKFLYLRSEALEGELLLGVRRLHGAVLHVCCFYARVIDKDEREHQGKKA